MLKLDPYIVTLHVVHNLLRAFVFVSPFLGAYLISVGSWFLGGLCLAVFLLWAGAWGAEVARKHERHKSAF